jgi:hypothetical protein
MPLGYIEQEQNPTYAVTCPTQNLHFEVLATETTERATSSQPRWTM